MKHEIIEQVLMKIKFILTTLIVVLFTSCQTTPPKNLPLAAPRDVEYTDLYRAYVTEVYDGDTVTTDIDLGLNVSLEDQKIRLADIDAPEMKGEEKLEGIISRDWLRRQILNQEIVLEAFERGKYGRIIGTIWKDGANINEELVARGLAESYP